MTHENSPEAAVVETGIGGPVRESTDRGITDAPMASLFEVTKLRNIRSGTGFHKAVAGQPREPDFIDEARVPLEQAESLFNALKGTLNAYLWVGIALTHDSLSSARESSPLLAAAILAVTALHAQDNSSSFDLCYPIFLELVSQSMFQRCHILDDVRGLCIGAFWLSDVSWKLSGLAVRVATELNLHHFRARARQGEVSTHRQGSFMLFARMSPLCGTRASWTFLVRSRRAIASTAKSLVFRILSRVYHTLGLERSRLVANDEFESIRRPNVAHPTTRTRIIIYHHLPRQVTALSHCESTAMDYEKENVSTKEDTLQADTELADAIRSYVVGNTEERKLIFFLGYLICEVPSSMILSRVPPSKYLPSIMLLWGALCAVMAVSNSYGALMSFRFVLRCIESGFFPGVLYLLRCWYTKAELGNRFAIFYTAAVLSGAFGGIVAGAITSNLDMAHGIRGWKWLFIVEGAVALFIYSLNAYGIG
ncbi:uncharacterized protein J7T54_001556 [Emericellopsis cladophorae]|uniref:Major facilitator superfamily (MFS) profile domain-containing protein n=1 Tax=Emericellopsis cladophorae TaxID=2686198 RepID=A0A9P9XUZ8_9HYPO|nr:uncharacterized protein J7T54_001556 [Emericellopsis cladophorae]KAI6777899.1 hypothetical protein J7T54_001556 [Emericellopsis cladophorae]